MTEIRQHDRVRVEILAVREREDGDRDCEVRLLHRDYRPEKWWSHCEILVRVPRTLACPEAGKAAHLVLGSSATSGREADAGGAYSFKVHEASEAPVCPPERPGADGFHIGLIEREEPPASGAIIYHLGSGVTCYLELPASVADREVENGQWWEFCFADGHQALILEPTD